jgi:hypothetical protein
MKPNELNHLRRLVAWVRCEIGQEPQEYVEMMNDDIFPKVGDISDYGVQRSIEHHERLKKTPAYVRQAVKILSKYLSEQDSRVFEVKRKKRRFIEATPNIIKALENK